MASEAIRPHVVGFLDIMLKEQSKTTRIEEIEVPEGSPWAGRALHDLNLKGRYNLLVLGLKNPHATEAEVIVNPPDQATVFGPSVVIALGDTKDVQRARQEANAHHP